MAEGLSHRHGFDSRVLACGTGWRTRQADVSGVAVTYAASPVTALSMPISPAYLMRLRSAASDLLQLHEPFPLGALGYLSLGRRARSRFGRMCIWWHSDVVRQRALRPLYRGLMTASLEAADAVLVATPNHIDSSEFLPDYRAKCRVVHYGVDPRSYALTSERAAQAADRRRHYGTRLVLFVGRLVYYKGVDHLIRAMRDVEGAMLLIVGDGPLRPRLEALAASEAPGRVTFVPPQSHPELVALYHASDVFVLPSVACSEQFGIVQLEAMACGKPVVATNLPTGVTYVNRHRITGLIVPPGDGRALGEAVREMLDDRELARELGEAGRRRVATDFTVDGMVDSVAQVYRDLSG